MKKFIPILIFAALIVACSSGPGADGAKQGSADETPVVGDDPIETPTGVGGYGVSGMDAAWDSGDGDAGDVHLDEFKIKGPSTPECSFGDPCEIKIRLEGGEGPYTCTSDTLPEGLEIREDPANPNRRIIDGSATQLGTFESAVDCTDSRSTSAKKTIVITITDTIAVNVYKTGAAAEAINLGGDTIPFYECIKVEVIGHGEGYQLEIVEMADSDKIEISDSCAWPVDAAVFTRYIKRKDGVAGEINFPRLKITAKDSLDNKRAITFSSLKFSGDPCSTPLTVTADRSEVTKTIGLEPIGSAKVTFTVQGAGGPFEWSHRSQPDELGGRIHYTYTSVEEDGNKYSVTITPVFDPRFEPSLDFLSGEDFGTKITAIATDPACEERKAEAQSKATWKLDGGTEIQEEIKHQWLNLAADDTGSKSRLWLFLKDDNDLDVTSWKGSLLLDAYGDASEGDYDDELDVHLVKETDLPAEWTNGKNIDILKTTKVHFKAKADCGSCGIFGDMDLNLDGYTIETNNWCGRTQGLPTIRQCTDDNCNAGTYDIKWYLKSDSEEVCTHKVRTRVLRGS